MSKTFRFYQWVIARRFRSRKLEAWLQERIWREYRTRRLLPGERKIVTRIATKGE